MHRSGQDEDLSEGLCASDITVLRERTARGDDKWRITLFFSLLKNDLIMLTGSPLTSTIYIVLNTEAKQVSL